MSALIPACPSGYTVAQLRTIFGDRFDDFGHWMRGQTAAICDGRLYDHDRGEYVPGCPEPHGLVTYPWDVDQFLKGGGPLD